jgi:hypothetical protein
MTKNSPRKPARPGKKAWQRPQIKSGRLFESNSLACGKNPSINQDQCMAFFQVS